MEFRRKNLYQATATSFATGIRSSKASSFEETLDAAEKIALLEGAQRPRRSPTAASGSRVRSGTRTTLPAARRSEAERRRDGHARDRRDRDRLGRDRPGAAADRRRRARHVDRRRSRLDNPTPSLGLFDGGAQGGRTTYMAGTATQKASVEMREQILDVAARTCSRPMRAISSCKRRGGRSSAAPPTGASSSPRSRGSLSRSAGASGSRAVATRARCSRVGATAASRGSVFGGFTGGSYHTHIAEVEVDPDTGPGHDPALHRRPGRRQGAQSAGDLGTGRRRRAPGHRLHALFEDLRLEDGVCVDWGFGSYRLPTAADAPEIELSLIEVPDPGRGLRRQGSRRGADHPGRRRDRQRRVSDAIGKPINRIPLTPFEVLEAINS